MEFHCIDSVEIRSPPIVARKSSLSIDLARSKIVSINRIRPSFELLNIGLPREIESIFQFDLDFKVPYTSVSSRKMHSASVSASRMLSRVFTLVSRHAIRSFLEIRCRNGILKRFFSLSPTHTHTHTHTHSLSLSLSLCFSFLRVHHRPHFRRWK